MNKFVTTEFVFDIINDDNIGEEVKVVALFDTGSANSFILESTVTQLNLHLDTKKYVRMNKEESI